jgi:hypothetical protein
VQDLAALPFHFQGAGKDGVCPFGFEMIDTVSEH